MEDTTKTWQEDLAYTINHAPAELKQRIRDFLAGALSTLKEVHEHEEDRV